MKVKVVAFGNELESFVEDRFADQLSVIYSDDNNRGKTLVMQGLMYSLGYESIFPSSFNYRDQYFYSKIDSEGEIFEFLRKNNSFIVRSEGSIQVFNSVTEFRYFFDKYIFSLPRIIKDNKIKMVDFSLFYELFFIGQDNRSSSGLISKGQFNKLDFKNMVFSVAGLMVPESSTKDIEYIKEEIKSLKQKFKTIRKKITIIRSNPNIAEYVSKTYDSEITQDKVKKIRAIHNNLSEIKKARQREINRKVKLESLVGELGSLNRSLSEGNVKCGECGSEKIVYSNDDLTFEISNTKVRQNILESIRNIILQKNEIITEFTESLNEEQDALNQELNSAPADFQDVIVYQDNILNDRDYDNESFNMSNRIRFLEEELNLKRSVLDDNKKAQNELLDNILLEMTKIYKVIEPNGNLTFDDLFTKKDLTFSGSEEQEYYFSKLMALNNVLNHDFPLIVDSFRDGELSTQKEEKMLDIYKSLDKQVILTSTLKKEEYRGAKYISDDSVNALDYSGHTDCKILQKSYSQKFKIIIDSFEGIII